MSARVRASGAGVRGEPLLSLVFTGKEDDLEVGLTYFGKRYLVPALGTWLNPDPLAVHSPGSADLNLYAYVSGKLLRATDPTGLCEASGTDGPCGGANNGTGGAAAPPPPDGDAAPKCSGTGPGCTGGAAGAPASTDDPAGKGAAMNVAEKLQAPGKVYAAAKANPGKFAVGVAVHAAKVATGRAGAEMIVEPIVHSAAAAAEKHGPMGAVGSVAVDGTLVLAGEATFGALGLARSAGAGEFAAEILADTRGSIGNVGRLGEPGPAIESAETTALDLLLTINRMNEASGEKTLSNVMSTLFKANGATPKHPMPPGGPVVTDGVTQGYLRVYREVALDVLEAGGPKLGRVRAEGVALGQRVRVGLIGALLGSGKVPP